MIVVPEVTIIGHDRSQLANMAEQTKKPTGSRYLIALADRGHHEGHEIRKCELAGIVPIVPKPLTSNGKSEGRFDKRDFVYDLKRDEYTCPAGQIAIDRFTTIEHGTPLHKYWPSACSGCSIKEKCTPSPYRRITRWEQERVLETMRERLDQAPQAARLRRQTVEHVFGTLKSWMGSTHLLTKTLPKLQAEMSLQVLASNLKRAMKILGAAPLMNAMKPMKDMRPREAQQPARVGELGNCRRHR